MTDCTPCVLSADSPPPASRAAPSQSMTAGPPSATPHVPHTTHTSCAACYRTQKLSHTSGASSFCLTHLPLLPVLSPPSPSQQDLPQPPGRPPTEQSHLQHLHRAQEQQKNTNSACMPVDIIVSCTFWSSLCRLHYCLGQEFGQGRVGTLGV
jgi:hypothetical protein